MPGSGTGIVWFRRDLRLGDHPALRAALERHEQRRIYNPALHMERYDPNGEYVRRYVPELEPVPDRYLREPWTMPAEQQEACGCLIGRDYPRPMVDRKKAREEALDRYRL